MDIYHIWFNLKPGTSDMAFSDKLAAYPRDNPVAPEDLLATIYHAMGISLESEVRDQENRLQRITDGKPVLALFG